MASDKQMICLSHQRHRLKFPDNSAAIQTPIFMAKARRALNILLSGNLAGLADVIGEIGISESMQALNPFVTFYSQLSMFIEAESRLLFNHQHLSSDQAWLATDW